LDPVQIEIPGLEDIAVALRLAPLLATNRAAARRQIAEQGVKLVARAAARLRWHGQLLRGLEGHRREGSQSAERPDFPPAWWTSIHADIIGQRGGCRMRAKVTTIDEYLARLN